MRLNRAVVVEAHQVMVVLELRGGGDYRLFKNDPVNTFGTRRCGQRAVVIEVVCRIKDEVIYVNWVMVT